VDNLDGTWTVTGSTVGSPTSPVVGPGTFGLFEVHFQTVLEGLATIDLVSLNLRDPNNAPIPAAAGDATILVDCTAPVAVTAITATTRHNKIDVGWTHDGTDVDHYEVFWGLWHDGAQVSAYPEYDDLPGNVIPARPANHAAAVAITDWTGLPGLTATNLTQTWTDAQDRGVYYYEVFAVDAVGNASPAAAANDRATNYWLGDIYGSAALDYEPNGLVDVRDINFMAPTFGDAIGLGDPSNIFDVGPTDDWSRLGVPTTDDRIDFEDLMVFSMNFGVVSPAKTEAPATGPVKLAWVDFGDGRMGLRLLEGTGLKGLRLRAGVPATVEAGGLLDEQDEMTFLKNVGENLDASLAVMGTNNAFAGSGDLIIVSLGEAVAMKDLILTARGVDNSTLEIKLEKAADTLVPRVFALQNAYPNPFNPVTKISFSLPESQDVKLVIYGIDGRRIATLVNETRGPGLHEVIWTGRDDAGKGVASGMYFYRIDAGPYSDVRKMTLMK